MGRRLRRQMPGGFQHITARGNNRQAVFWDDVDYSTYLEILDAGTREFDFEVHSLSLMPNHVHDLARFERDNMPKAIEYVHGTYARFFNQRHSRVGHVFQDRYFSKLVADERYLHEVARYIHANPVEAGLCERPEDYVWSTFSEYYHEAPIRVPCPGPVTAPFTCDGRLDRMAFWDFTMARCGGVRPEWYSDDLWAPPSASPTESPVDPRSDAITAAVAREFGVLPSELRPSDDSRLVGGARGVALLLLREELPWSLRKIGRVLGMKTPQGTARAIGRTKRRLEIDPCLRQTVERLRRAILP